MEQIKTGADLAGVLTDFMNTGGTGTKKREFAAAMMRQHRTLQQLAFGLMLQTIKSWSEQEYFDDRNEQTVKTCKKIMASLDEDDLILPFI